MLTPKDISPGKSFTDHYECSITIIGPDDRWFVTGEETDPMWYIEVWDRNGRHEEMLSTSGIIDQFSPDSW